MRKVASPYLISHFFGDNVELFELNIIIVLDFLLQQKKHKKIIKDIIAITSPEVSFSTFKKVVREHKKELENHDEPTKKLLGKKIETSGKVLKPLKSSPIRWLFLALYWAFNSRDNNFEDVNKIYDDRIGNIALLFLLKKNKMQQMELKKGLEVHPLKFYTDLGVRVVRAIEILTQMSLQDNAYLYRIYLSPSIQDIVENFFMTISSNRFESNTLSIGESEAGRAIKYQNIHYGIELIVPTTRMLKDGFLSEPEDTLREWLQLMNLEPKNTGNRISKGGIRRKKQKQIYDEIDSALIPVTMIDPSIMNEEEEVERENKTLSTRSIYSDKEQNNIPSSLMQHRQNGIFSSIVTKNNIFQESEYDVPPIPILTLYCQTLKDVVLSDKFFKSLFLVSISTGIKTEDIISFVAGEKQNAFKLKDTTLITQMETDFFSKKKFSDLFVNTDTILSYELPVRMAMILASLKRNYQTISIAHFCLWFHGFSFSPRSKVVFSLKKSSIQFFTPKDSLLANYVQYLTKHTKKFKYKISNKPSKTHRYLFHYINSIDGDLRTAKLAADSHNRNDRSRLAYTSARKNATLHSQYIKQFWVELDFDRTSDNLIGISTKGYKTTISELSAAQYSGSSLVVKAEVSQIFFKSLLINIEDCTNDSDRFNLISIYVRYALALLAGTREFSNSANFTSWSQKQNMLSINEKSSSWSMGIRYIPLNQTISNILTFYQNILIKKGLSTNVYLCRDNTYSTYTAGDAVLVIEDMLNLTNKEVLRQYTLNVPLNVGRHIFTCKSLDQDIPQAYVDAFLGHYGKGEEQLGSYSCLNLRNFNEHIQTITSIIQIEHGIKELK